MAATTESTLLCRQAKHQGLSLWTDKVIHPGLMVELVEGTKYVVHYKCLSCSFEGNRFAIENFLQSREYMDNSGEFQGIHGWTHRAILEIVTAIFSLNYDETV